MPCWAGLHVIMLPPPPHVTAPTGKHGGRRSDEVPERTAERNRSESLLQQQRGDGGAAEERAVPRAEPRRLHGPARQNERTAEVHRCSRHGPRPAGGLPHGPDQEAGRRRGDRRAGRRPLSLLEEPAGAGEGEPAGSEPLGARPQGPLVEGGPPDCGRPGGRSPRRPRRPDGAGAGQSRTGLRVCVSGVRRSQSQPGAKEDGRYPGEHRQHRSPHLKCVSSDSGEAESCDSD